MRAVSARSHGSYCGTASKRRRGPHHCGTTCAQRAFANSPHASRRSRHPGTTETGSDQAKGEWQVRRAKFRILCKATGCSKQQWPPSSESPSSAFSSPQIVASSRNASLQPPTECPALLKTRDAFTTSSFLSCWASLCAAQPWHRDTSCTPATGGTFDRQSCCCVRFTRIPHFEADHTCSSCTSKTTRRTCDAVLCLEGWRKFRHVQCMCRRAGCNFAGNRVWYNSVLRADMFHVWSWDDNHRWQLFSCKRPEERRRSRGREGFLLTGCGNTYSQASRVPKCVRTEAVLSTPT